MAAAAAGDNDTELDALRTALDLTAGDPSIKAMLAEALSRAADGQITIPARNLIDEVLAVNPNEPRALYMAGLAAYQDENFADAVALWQRLHSQSRPDAPWMATLGQNIIDAAEKGGLPVPDVAPSPDQGMLDMAAGMSDEERAEMIEGMVATLAARLAENTDDLNGWLRLARAYDVLGRQEDMVRAMIGAADAVPDDARQQTMALEVMVTSNLGAQFLDSAPRLLARLEALAPDGLELLFFKGHFARLSGDPEAVRQNWQLLLERLPADSPLAANLKARIDQL
jgi:cytochrome c-type biogenesis protein CcmH